MEWEIKKELMIGDLVQNSEIAWKEFKRVVDFLDGHFGYMGYAPHRHNILTMELVEYAAKYPCFIKFLEEDGYVERIEEKKDPWDWKSGTWVEVGVAG